MSAHANLFPFPTLQPPSTLPSPGTQVQHWHPQRIPVSNTASLMLLDLQEEIAGLRREPAWQYGRNAKTLLKHDDLRLVLTLMRKGECLHPHSTRGTLFIQCIQGSLRVQLSGESFDLQVGQLLALDPRLSHRVEALEESAFLLSIAWPPEPPKQFSARVAENWRSDESVWN